MYHQSTYNSSVLKGPKMKKFLRPLIPLLALSLSSCGNFDDKPEQTEEQDFEAKLEETRKVLMNNIHFTNKIADELNITVVLGSCTIEATNEFIKATTEEDLEQIINSHNGCLSKKIATSHNDQKNRQDFSIPNLVKPQIQKTYF